MKNFISNIFTKNSNENKEPTVFLMKKIPIKKQYLIFMSLTAISAICSLGAFSYSYSRSQQLNYRITDSTNIQMLSQKLSKNVQQVMSSNQKMFNELNSDFSELATYYSELYNGSEKVKPLEANLQTEVIDNFRSDMNSITDRINSLNNKNKIIVDFAKNSNSYQGDIKKLVKDLNKYIFLMAQKNSNSFKILEAETLVNSLLSLSSTLSLVNSTQQIDGKTLGELNSELTNMDSSIKFLLADDGLIEPFILDEIKTILNNNKTLLEKLPSILKDAKLLVEAKKAGFESIIYFDSVYSNIGHLKEVSIEELEKLDNLKLIASLLALSTLLFISMLAYLNIKETQIQAWKTKRDNDETDEAIIQIMTELQPIAEGNLKTRATVNEHAISSIAHNINVMAESLQEAILSTKNISSEVSTKMTSVKELISNASNLAKLAEESARQSNSASVVGAQMVNQAAGKMEEARNKMQETSKRVKRLGEVSQAIGSITDLIEEMTEKTAVLALNTQLKASESGSDGHSFRTIAEEIRKLSEESKKSLATIRSNVQNMQSETQTVMISIEQTTSNVVEGSVLWEQAEKDLLLIQEAAKKIEDITQQLNSLSSEQVDKAMETESNMQQLNDAISKFNV